MCNGVAACGEFALSAASRSAGREGGTPAPVCLVRCGDRAYNPTRSASTRAAQKVEHVANPGKDPEAIAGRSGSDDRVAAMVSVSIRRAGHRRNGDGKGCSGKRDAGEHMVLLEQKGGKQKYTPDISRGRNHLELRLQNELD
jgi:hypothetical protein